MKATLVHNPGAGRSSVSPQALLDEIGAAGYDPVYRSMADCDPPGALQDPGDVVVVAGGDGTVSDIAVRLRNSGIPLVVVPTGTANNFARCLGIPLDPRTAIAEGLRGVPRRVDLGCVTTAAGCLYFLEGFGFGVFPHIIRVIEEERDHSRVKASPVTVELLQDLRCWRRELSRASAVPFAIDVDGKDLSGTYLLVEALNIAGLGPDLRLAREADPSDGMFELVLLGQERRRDLLDVLETRIAGGESRSRIPAHRTKRALIHAPATVPVRVDGRVVAAHELPPGRDGLRTIEITVEESAVTVLVPPS